MKTIVTATRVCAIISVILFTGCATRRLLHKPEAGIRSSLLEKTPVGTSKQHVERFIKQEGWWSSPNKNGDISAYLGRYGLLNDYRVSALWMFDKGGSLTNVLVEKRNDFL